MSRPTKLAILPLPYPLILLPAARLTIALPAEVGEALLALFQTNDSSLPIVAAVPAVNHPANSSLAQYGTAARVLRLVRSPLGRNSLESGDTQTRPFLASLHGLTRISYPSSFQLKDSVDSNSDVPVQVQARESIVKFKSAALRILQHMAQNSSQQGRKDAFHKIAAMLEDIKDEADAWMADVLVGSVLGQTVKNPSAANETLLSTSNSLSRLQLATMILTKLFTKLEVTTRIANAVDESLSKQQKEFFLRQQLRAIEKELKELQGVSNGISGNPSPSNSIARNSSDLDLDSNESEDAELMDIRRKLEAMEPGSEERKAGVREWRRLKRLMGTTGGGGSSVEGGVLRAWLEWFTALPWSPVVQHSSAHSTITTSAFLAEARAQLDSDHYGLDKVKKRLIEYLAVVKLKELAELAEERRLVLESQKPEVASALEEVAGAADPEAREKDLQVVLHQTQPTQIQPSIEHAPRRAKGVKGPILLQVPPFVGPPGTGKTSLGQSIARALNRPFQRISLGGVRDEAEIRGHRRTYVASGPGLIVQALRKAGRPDFVCLLDEIDKIGNTNFHGDPGAALLEVLDPEQNCNFNDHYINVPIDLSQVLFICTANTLETISAPLLDRCEIVVLPGYTYDEKLHIARKFLLPKQLKSNGLTDEHVKFTEEALKAVATRYTREAGVRTLERSIGSVVRFKAVEWAECLDAIDAHDGKITINEASSSADLSVINLDDSSKKALYKPLVEESELEAILGIARWEDGEENLAERNRGSRRGIVYGLVVMGQGEGGILPVETIVVPTGNKSGSGEGGRLRLTGSLGDVIKESGELALSWVKTHSYDLGITTSPFQDPLKGLNPFDIHLHLPAGAQRKDGPSAGVAMTCALVSLLTGACVPTDVAMTGEITLRGRVTPVGGIKEKVLGAHRAQIRKVILPYANRKDVEHDVAPEIRNVMEFVFVRNLQEALEAAFGNGVIGWRRELNMLESRL
ncbi:Lon protease C-terminal proteolytic domain-containing protein [Rhodocollybia butyracea]|uniref:Lon protease C-terminal proteolytic domain-containing protein n=1 Tax=Rhodocollybia butyracea TaxID=206335 RepID=A0A9P5Q537_9AGAR|nr:Lon protease C-terminal proteolytic domain-containing protein [Rhodocollybia butyracea]